MFRKCLISTGLGLCLVPSAYAVDVTVNSTQPEVAGVNYQTVTGALYYVSSQAAPRTVRVTGGGPYSAGENFGTSVSVTLKGDGYRPILAAPATAGFPSTTLNGHGFVIYTDATAAGTPITVRLENLVLIPALTGGPVSATSKGLRSNNNAAGLSNDQMNIELVDVNITANDGTNNPISVDGLTSTTAGTPVFFGDDGVFIAGIADLACTGTKVSNTRGAAASSDNIVFNPDVAAHTLYLGPGCVVGHAGRIGIQVARNGSIVRMSGTASNPVVFTGNWNEDAKNSALSFFNSDAAVVTNDAQLSYVVFKANNAMGLLHGFTSTPAQTLTLDHVAFDSNQEAAFALAQNRGTNPVTLANCTLVNNALRTTGSANPQIAVLAEGTGGGSTGAVTFTDCILAGNGTAGDGGTGANLIQISATSSPTSFINCGIPTSGSYAVGTGKFRLVSAPAPTETAEVNADPSIQNVGGNHTVAASYLAVSSGSYAGAGSASSNLSGYGPYIGPNAAVSEWKIY